MKMMWLLPVRYRWLMVVGSLFSMMHGVVFPVFSIAFGELFNVIFEYADDPATLRMEAATISYIFVGLAAYNLLVGYLCQMMWGFVGDALGLHLRRDFFAAIIRQDVGYFDRHRSGQLVSMLSSDIESVRAASGSKVSLCISLLTQMLAGVVIAFVYSWKMTLVLIAISPALGISSILRMRMLAKRSQSAAGVFGDASSFAAEIIQGFPTVASFVWQGEAHKKYEKRVLASEDLKEVHFSALSFGFSFFFMFLVYALGFWWGSELVARGELEVGDLLIVFFSIIIGGMALGQMSTVVGDFAKGRGVAAAIIEVIQRKPLVDANPQGITRLDDGSVEFRNVSFTFPSRPDAPVLKGLSFTVQPGHTVGICGSSGAGKSTTVALAERFYDAAEGTVLVGGRDVRDYNLHWLRSQMGLVSQEPVLFDSSIRDNIRFGKLDASDAEVEEAARQANAHQFIMDLPNGYDTVVGEGGGQLSGGQKQRIAIARCIVKNPSILFLDEATSALDSKSEATVQEALDQAMVGRTTIVIAHRLSTIKNSDVIIVMEDGQIAEQGHHWELLGRKGLYYALVVRQLSPQELQELEVLMGKYLSGEYRPTVKSHHASGTASQTCKEMTAEDFLESRLPLLEREWNSGLEITK